MVPPRSISVESVYTHILEGQLTEALAAVQTCLADGVFAEEILLEGCVRAMGEVGHLFEECEYFLPEMLVFARALKGTLEVLIPILLAHGATPAARSRSIVKHACCTNPTP